MDEPPKLKLSLGSRQAALHFAKELLETDAARDAPIQEQRSLLGQRLRTQLDQLRELRPKERGDTQGTRRTTSAAVSTSRHLSL